MATPSGSEQLHPDRPFPFPGIQDYLLEGTNVFVGTLTAPAAAGGQTKTQVVALGLFEGKLLVALPQTAWHRVAARRLLGPDSIRKTVHAEILASSVADQAVPHPSHKLKVWLGLLADALVGGISFEESEDPPCCFRGWGALASVDMTPYGPSLSAIAGERFAFVTAAENGSEAPGGEPSEPPEEQSWEQRLTGLEAGLSRLQSSLDLLARSPNKAAEPPPPAAGIGEVSRAAPGLNREGLPGLDPTVVGAARQAGIPEEQLQKMSLLAMQGVTERQPRPGAPKPKATVQAALDESEDEAPDEGAQLEASGSPMELAVLQMSKILANMQKDRNSDLENLLDRADGGGEGASGSGAGRSKSAAYHKLKGLLKTAPEQIGASIEQLMSEDFAQVQSGPRQQNCACSARGWVEHRSHLQQYAGPIRQAWLLAAGMIDAINAGAPEQAKAMGLLGLASLDQASIDGGSWLLASEYSLESAPPFSAFQRPRALDPLEAKQTRLLDPRWVSLFMARLKERDAFHTAKRNLSGQSSSGAGAGEGAAGSQPDRPDPPRRPPRKSKGEGKDKDKDKEGKGRP